MTWRDENARQVKALVEECYQKGKVLGGICDASAFLGTVGVLNDVTHTSNDMNDLKQWAGSVYTGETKYIAKQAVRDKNIITAIGMQGGLREWTHRQKGLWAYGVSGV